MESLEMVGDGRYLSSSFFMISFRVRYMAEDINQIQNVPSVLGRMETVRFSFYKLSCKDHCTVLTVWIVDAHQHAILEPIAPSSRGEKGEFHQDTRNITRDNRSCQPSCCS